MARAFPPAALSLIVIQNDKLNPLDWDTVRELKNAVAEIDARRDVVAVVVTGRGRSFSAGGDLEGYLTLYRHPDRLAAFLDDFYTMLTAIEASSKIYIAAVNGVAMGGGFEVALACDLIIASDNATFALPEPRVGLPKLAQPHRGGAVLTIGILSLLLHCFPLGIVAWVMGSNDLAAMRRGEMLRTGEGVTRAGQICGMISSIIFIISAASGLATLVMRMLSHALTW